MFPRSEDRIGRRPSNSNGAYAELRGRVIVSNGVPMTKARVLRSRVRSKDSRTVLKQRWGSGGPRLL
jgi:hypothetical protein